MALDKKQELKNTLPGGAQNAQTSAAATPYRAQETQNNGNNKINEASDAPAYSPYKGLPGLSNTTAANMGKYQQGYTASDAVNQAQAYLDNLLNNKPSDYASNYTQQLNDLYGQIMNRDPFQYNLNEDMLYQQVKDQYMLTGQQAMMDTMGQAAALSGGYGSSYASTAGNQAYQQYLTALNNMVPDLYDRAYEQYRNEGEDLYNRYALAQQADQTDYARWQDAVNQWNADRAFGLDQYSTLYSQDYGQYADARDYWANMAAQESSNYWNERSQAYQTAMAMLEKGKMPSKDMLEAAGISTKDAKKWISKDKAAAPSGPSTSTSTKTDTTPAVLDLQAVIDGILNGRKAWG